MEVPLNIQQPSVNALTVVGNVKRSGAVEVTPAKYVSVVRNCPQPTATILTDHYGTSPTGNHFINAYLKQCAIYQRFAAY